jgi:hypothetical protein
MGAYFSMGTAKALPPFAVVTDATASPAISLRSGKLMAKAFAASFEGAERESVARCFTLKIIESYWAQIQAGATRPFPLPEFFALEKSTTLPERAPLHTAWAEQPAPWSLLPPLTSSA